MCIKIFHTKPINLCVYCNNIAYIVTMSGHILYCIMCCYFYFYKVVFCTLRVGIIANNIVTYTTSLTVINVKLLMCNATGSLMTY